MVIYMVGGLRWGGGHQHGNCQNRLIATGLFLYALSVSINTNTYIPQFHDRSCKEIIFTVGSRYKTNAASIMAGKCSKFTD